MPESIDNPLPISEETGVEAAQPSAISERKLKTNRENAKKSTGPKTARGKAHSRRNAIKHGIFARHGMEFVLLGENSLQYDELLADLCKQYQPVGRAEELEVERIALCWWKLRRVERYESAVTKVAIRDLGKKELARQEPYCAKLSEEEDALILQLESAKDELDENGAISEELKKKIFAARNRLESMWPSFESQAEALLKANPSGEIVETFTAEERSYVLGTFAVTLAIAFVKQIRQFRTKNVAETAIEEHVIPKPEILDRILRYETAIERNLGRAIDRLDRLQRRRQGEHVPPSVNLRLTQ
jgi:hypothetical protein